MLQRIQSHFVFYVRWRSGASNAHRRPMVTRTISHWESATPSQSTLCCIQTALLQVLSSCHSRHLGRRFLRLFDTRRPTFWHGPFRVLANLPALPPQVLPFFVLCSSCLSRKCFGPNFAWMHCATTTAEVCSPEPCPQFVYWRVLVRSTCCAKKSQPENGNTEKLVDDENS